MRTLTQGLALCLTMFAGIPLILAWGPFAGTKIAVATAWDVEVAIPIVDDGCGGSTPACVFDGTPDFQGTSAASASVLSEDQTSVQAITGPEVNVYEGSGAIAFEIVSAYQPGGTSQATVVEGAGSAQVYPGYSLRWTYHPTTGAPVTYTRGAHPGSEWIWTTTIPRYPGQLASIDVELTPLARLDYAIERNQAWCGQTYGSATIDIRATLWRL